MNDWEAALARTLFEDRVDRGTTEAETRAKAVRYADWLERMKEPHDPRRCPDEEFLRRWPGDLGFHTGQATVIVSKQGGGKTNACSRLIEAAIEHRPDWDIFTNVPFPWDYDPQIPRPPRLFGVHGMEELLAGVSRTILAGRKPAIAIDEMDQVVTSHSWARDTDESWVKFLFVERHFRARGPLLVYHVREHVPLPLRRRGDLRGSYFRLVIRDGRRKLIRVEDPSQWWVITESRLPFLTLGLRGFSIDVDMEELLSRVDGDSRSVAQQVLDYLAERRQRVEEAEAESEDRKGHAIVLQATRKAKTEQRDAYLRRREEIIQAFLREPDLTQNEACKRFRTSPRLVVELREVARRRSEFEGR